MNIINAVFSEVFMEVIGKDELITGIYLHCLECGK